MSGSDKANVKTKLSQIEALLLPYNLKYLKKQQLYALVNSIRQALSSDTGAEVTPESVADFLSPCVQVFYHAMDSQRMCGMLIKNAYPQVSPLIINARHSPQAQRFTLSHEIIHYLIHPDRNYLCDTGDARSSLEWQANEGAAELLLPYRIFIPQLCAYIQSVNRHTGGHKPSSTELLLPYAQKYGVTLTTLQNRLTGLRYEIDQYMSGCPLESLEFLSEAELTRRCIHVKPLFFSV
ncbi:MAG: ImmA/IrrE family metallo-endopeptidase [Firmicutes bacterium]|nr:ImmA/IrrE family metallo-endopeptidase [Bacillota bacterium]